MIVVNVTASKYELAPVHHRLFRVMYPSIFYVLIQQHVVLVPTFPV